MEVQRNKGLGEMDADDFWNTVLDPQRRTVIRVCISTTAMKLHHPVRVECAEGRRVDSRRRVPRRHMALDLGGKDL